MGRSAVNTKPDTLAIVDSISGATKTSLSNAWASITLILNQFPNIADGWSSINEAKYKIEKFKSIMQIISLKVDRMSDAVNSIEDLKKRWASTANDKADIMVSIRTEALRLHGLYGDIRAKIDDLKVSMKKVKRSLTRRQRNQRTNMLSSAIHFTTNFLEHYAVEKEASPILKVVQVLLFALLLTNGVIYWIAGNELKRPRGIKIEILYLENRIEESKNTFVEAEEWIELNDPIKLNNQTMPTI
ncbi:hypothetical protein HA402_002650 [Bradysia odoriphaga]|nr:hypothetical protein HA402_002650 [Bradysia odoriphaga]